MMASDRSGRGLGAGSKQGTAAFDDNLQIGDPSVALVGPDQGPYQGAQTAASSPGPVQASGDVSLAVGSPAVTSEDAPEDAGVGLMA